MNIQVFLPFLAAIVSICPAGAALVGWWSFETNANDAMGNFGASSLSGAASVVNGRLSIPNAPSDYLVSGTYLGSTISEKTLVSWVLMDSLAGRGGSVLTLQNSSGTVFDGIVYAEREELRWIAGSDFYNRTQDVGGTDEVAGSTTLVQLAAVYRSDNSITLFRDGVAYGVSYTKGNLQSFVSGNAEAVFGLRHEGALLSNLSAHIEDARIYNEALTQQQLIDLQPNVIPEPSAGILVLAGYSAFSLRRKRVAGARSGSC